VQSSNIRFRNTFLMELLIQASTKGLIDWCSFVMMLPHLAWRLQALSHLLTTTEDTQRSTLAQSQPHSHNSLLTMSLNHASMSDRQTDMDPPPLEPEAKPRRKSSFSDALNKFTSNTFNRRRTTNNLPSSTSLAALHTQSRLPTPAGIPRVLRSSARSTVSRRRHQPQPASKSGRGTASTTRVKITKQAFPNPLRPSRSRLPQPTMTWESNLTSHLPVESTLHSATLRIL